MQPQKNELQLDNPLEPCRAIIVRTSGTQVVPNSNKQYQRTPVIRGETAAASGAKPVAKAQPMSVLPGYTLPVR